SPLQLGRHTAGWRATGYESTFYRPLSLFTSCAFTLSLLEHRECPKQERIWCNKRMTVSVAMCTWNGSAFVLEQLRSIVEQTRAVNEIVVCDDHSDDNTADLVHHFAQSSPVPVRLHRNEVNIGFCV